MNRNPVEVQWAKETAKRLFKRFSFQGNQLGSYQLSSMIGQTYQLLNLGYKANSNDSKSMTQVLDANKDGKVTYQDFEEMCIKYLCDGISLGSQSFGNRQSPQSSPQRKNQITTSGFQNINYQQNINNYGSGQRQIFDKYSNQNQINSQNQIKKQTSYTSYPYKQPEYIYSNAINESSNNTTTKTYTNNRQESNVNASQSVNQSISNTENRQFNQQVRQYLEMTQHIFFKYALKQSQTITQREVPDVLSQTYAALGRQGYRPTQQDIKVWMKLCDGNEDGHVQYDQYQYFVVRSLERSGVNLYEQ